MKGVIRMHYTVLINYGERADGLFSTFEQAFNWAVALMKADNNILVDNRTDEEIYEDNSDFCRVIELEI